jgi:tripartite-type tricarboxylate transporter receptor subunit TctC
MGAFMLRRREVIAGLAGTIGASLGVSGLASADTKFPSGNVRFVVPFTAGGPTDVFARLCGDAMSKKWSVPVIIENKPGAGTIAGTAEVAHSPPDGTTLGFVISAHTINPAIRKKLPYDTLRDFRGVSELAEAHVVLVTNPAFPADDLAGLLKIARGSSEPLAFASPGTGTSTHLAGELLQRVAGIKMLHVPYNGSAPALTDVLANRVPLMFDIWHSVQQYVDTGQLKVIGVANAHSERCAISVHRRDFSGLRGEFDFRCGRRGQDTRCDRFPAFRRPDRLHSLARIRGKVRGPRHGPGRIDRVRIRRPHSQADRKMAGDCLGIEYLDRLR